LPQAFDGEVLESPVADPYGGSLEEYRRVRDEIDQLLHEKLLRG
jgi:protein-tyrosine-phosphatase